jgi:AcrR family transcriptional regulator
LEKGRKDTQRERLLAGMVEAANRHGYANATVSAVIALAGVSRPTFYEYFRDKDDCFLAAIADVHERLLGQIRAELKDEDPERTATAPIAALLAFSTSQPARARFLMSEAMAGGREALTARDAGIAEVARLLERGQTQTGTATAVPDLAPSVLIGATYRLLAVRLRRGEPLVTELLDDLLAWAHSYEQPADSRRWSTLEPEPELLAPSARDPGPAAAGAPQPGRSEQERSTERRRQRILLAAAQLAHERGYSATTVADISERAGIDSRSFYPFFADRHSAFMTLHEIAVQKLTSVTASAFFSAATWPERIWEAGRGSTELLRENPLLAHLGFVESAAIGPSAVQRVEDTCVAFTIFLQEGYQQRSLRPPPSRLALEATVGAIFEIVYRQARAGSIARISALLPHMTFLCLAPFLGAAEANRFIDRKMGTRPHHAPR